MKNSPLLTTKPDPAFIDLFGDRTVRDLLSEHDRVLLDSDAHGWLDFPDSHFIEFARTLRTPFDSIPSGDHHLKPPSYLISQAHRIWQTVEAINQQVEILGAKSIVDFGSFPFIVPIILRKYYGFSGKILATYNLPLSQVQEVYLRDLSIDLAALDLDPFVHDPRVKDELPAQIEGSSNTFDLAISTHVVEHLYHPKWLFDEAKRVLSPRGRLIVTTDNAMMADTFINYVGGYGYTFEPVEQTAAMVFNFWRGHVRFFTRRDLEVLAHASEFKLVGAGFFHCLYDIIFEEYFKDPRPYLPAWKLGLLEATPSLRNDIVLVVEK